ncbi:DoxX family protein, partial [Streptomyces sp. TRM76130]|nr:DoxX family protein [Streptomyces sp. TRM76130]
MAHGMRTDTSSGDGAPDRCERVTRYALLPLRVFLGVTFLYAGVDKLTDSA